MDEPIKIGSAALSQLVPEPGGEIQTNEYNVDVISLTYFFGSAATVDAYRPARGDIYAGVIASLAGFKCDDSTVQIIEGTSARLRVNYMRPRYDMTVRNAVDTDVVFESVTGFASITPWPNATVTRQYPAQVRPNAAATSLTDAQGQALGFPPIVDDVINFSSNGTNTGTLNFTAIKYWLKYKFSYTPRCNSAFYECKDIWRTFKVSPAFVGG